jgi:hypothetical protein
MHSTAGLHKSTPPSTFVISASQVTHIHAPHSSHVPALSTTHTVALHNVYTHAHTRANALDRVFPNHTTRSHHLKHESRLLLTLFLKRAGMTAHDQSELYETEYLKVMTRADFEKKRW